MKEVLILIIAVSLVGVFYILAKGRIRALKKQGKKNANIAYILQ